MEKLSADSRIREGAECSAAGAAAASGALDISIPDMEVEIKKKVKPRLWS